MSEYLDTWERAAKAGHPPQPRKTVEPVTPAARIIELSRALETESRFLEEACVEIRRLQEELRRLQKIGGVSFGGVPAAQIWTDFILWEVLLNENPELAAIVELGTWEGGFSLWLHAQAEVREMQFRTFDSIVPPRFVPNFERVDVFAEAERISGIIWELEPVILFCDNGNKPRELKTFPPLFQDNRSLAVVHDWGTEMFLEDVPQELEMVYESFCEKIGSISRVFKKRWD